MTEEFPHQPLGAIARDGGADLPRRRNTEARDALFPFSREHRHEAARTFRPGLVDKLEVGPLADVLGGPEGGHLLLV